MLNSVRVRMAVGAAAVMTTVLVVLAVVIYWIVRENAIDHTDATVAEQSEAFLKTVEAEGSEGEPGGIKSALAAAIAEHRFRETIFVVADQSETVLASSAESVSGGSHGKLSASPHDVISKLAHAGRSFQTVHVGRRSYRTYIKSFPVSDTMLTLFAFESLHSQEEFLETLANTFALVIPLAIVLAGLGGYFLARKGLSPISAMGQKAAWISADSLHDRLPVRNANDELGHLAQTFNGLLDRLERAFEQQRRFVADASHELRTPVAILCGEAEVALSRPDRSPEEYCESLAILRDEAIRLKHIVDDLFTLARADAGQHPLAPADFYLDELIAECVRNTRTLAAAKHITVRYEASKELPIRADEGLLRRALLNLLANAIKYTPADGDVSVSCEEDQSGYAVIIRDTGRGIAEELQPRIFERFFRADTARSHTDGAGGGAGLGLSISQWIAHAHSGRLELTRSNADGSTFTIFLPKTADSR